MNIFFAPMEGLSGYIYRNAHYACFNNVDKYFSPFVSANESGSFKKRELEDLSPEHNRGLVLVPQLLTNKAKEFILFADRIKRMGYNEINLNLGCPSGTVVAKNRGAGFLAKTAELDAFLYEIFAWGGTRISVKTRIGKEHTDEFFELLEIFNKYPIAELTIHPRIQRDFYKNKPDMEMFRYALKHSKNPICYNGNLFTAEQVQEFSREFPNVGAVMLGRGLLVNPGLTKEIKTNIKVDKNTIKAFYDTIFNEYRKVLPGDVTVLYRMKEIWFYMILMFSNHEKYAKKIRKSTRLSDYEDVVSSLFKEQDLLESYEGNLDKV
jgi:tRNA-dihydrouridine synthase